MKKELFIPNKLKEEVSKWRETSYDCDYPVISEILDYNVVISNSGEKSLRFLRQPQFDALEVYWYLRIVKDTPHVLDIYKNLYSSKELLEALGLKHLVEDLTDDLVSETLVNDILNKVKYDDNFVKEHKLESLRETLTLNYPSYIFALAMGAGKTVLIGAIIATEFAMALEYQDNKFVKNVLVFAPGKTILGALRELSDVPYEKILPPRLYKEFITSVKFTYTRDGESDIPIIKGSSFNIIVTNTEKIRIQKQAITKAILKDIKIPFSNNDESKEDQIKEEVANLRLQTIASLPNLAIFSDEAHHTYGNTLDKGLKKVRKTVDYLAYNTNVLVVVNTTGTPYYKKQVLKDVVFWYGLSQGIKDGILKEVRGNIVGYEEVSDEEFIKDVVNDFFDNYENVKIYDGSPAKLAIYFPKVDDLIKSKPIVEKTLVERGLDPSIILEVHNESPDEVKDLFDNRINDPKLQYRVFLLVNKGTEGWNCLSLFATALAREIKSSNNFCLQAATRCLRQISGNTYKAKIYLSKNNTKILDRQLKDNFGESIQELNRTSQKIFKGKIVLRKEDLTPIKIKKKIRKIVPINNTINVDDLYLEKPSNLPREAKKIIFDLNEISDRKGVLVAKKEENIVLEEDYIDVYSFAVELSSLYRLPLLKIYKKIIELYPNGEIPFNHSNELKKQLEEQIKNYEIIEEVIEQSIAIVKKEGFIKEERENNELVYTAEIIYHKDKAEKLFAYYEDLKNINSLDFSFHYNPYNFDSQPEKDFFINLLEDLNQNPDDVEDIYFTGAITDPNKTDFFFEYKGVDERWHTYTPDFLIRKKDGKIIIVEIKMEKLKNDNIDGENGLKAIAVKNIQHLNPDKIKFEMLFTDSDEIGISNLKKIKELIYKQWR